jgi:calcium-dependent protein kinase
LWCLGQVLLKDYAHAADVWSAGVIMFILLSGYPPFAGSSDARILQRVQQGSYSFRAREVRDAVETVLVYAAASKQP